MQKYVLKQKIARAKSGDADGQYELGRAYLYGEDIKQNKKKGEKYLLQSAVQKHAGAQFELGKYYLKSDAEKAENWLGKATNNGSCEAAYLMGMQYYDGEHAPRNLQKAELWYEFAAKRGHLPSMTMLGAIYDMSKDRRRKTEAKELLEKAAEQGYAEAQYLLANSYYGKDTKQAIAWLEKSAKGNYYPANEKLAYFYLAEDTAESFKKAINAFTVAAENGNLMAANQLGNIYYDGRFNARRDPDKAFYWYTKAGGKGLTGVGKCYLYGVGVERDYNKAFKMLSEVSVYNAYAKYELGNCYFNGWGVSQDKLEAKRLWQQSAEKGCDDAKKALAENFK